MYLKNVFGCIGTFGWYVNGQTALCGQNSWDKHTGEHIDYYWCHSSLVNFLQVQDADSKAAYYYTEVNAFNFLIIS